jgi:hypothetical protein
MALQQLLQLNIIIVMNDIILFGVIQTNKPILIRVMSFPPPNALDKLQLNHKHSRVDAHSPLGAPGALGPMYLLVPLEIPKTHCHKFFVTVLHASWVFTYSFQVKTSHDIIFVGFVSFLGGLARKVRSWIKIIKTFEVCAFNFAHKCRVW